MKSYEKSEILHINWLGRISEPSAVVKFGGSLHPQKTKMDAQDNGLEKGDSFSNFRRDVFAIQAPAVSWMFSWCYRFGSHLVKKSPSAPMFKQEKIWPFLSLTVW